MYGTDCIWTASYAKKNKNKKMSEWYSACCNYSSIWPFVLCSWNTHLIRIILLPTKQQQQKSPDKFPHYILSKQNELPRGTGRLSCYSTEQVRFVSGPLKQCLTAYSEDKSQLLFASVPLHLVFCLESISCLPAADLLWLAVEDWDC